MTRPPKKGEYPGKTAPDGNPHHLNGDRQPAPTKIAEGVVATVTVSHWKSRNTPSCMSGPMRVFLNGTSVGLSACVFVCGLVGAGVGGGLGSRCTGIVNERRVRGHNV